MEEKLLDTTFYKCVAQARKKISQAKLDHFSQLTTDAERIAFLIESNVYEDLQVAPAYKEKCASTAEKLKTEGNKYFQEKRYRKALELYNRAVLTAPCDTENNILAVAHANRSAALFHLGQYEECLEDISMASDRGYPDDARYKLFDRRAKCLMKQNQHKHAIKDLEKAIENVKISKLKDEQQEKWTKDLRSHLETCKNFDKPSEIKQASAKDQIPYCKFKPGTKLSDASGAVQVGFTASRGRHVIAEENINVGEVVMLQEPFTSILYKKHCTSHCYHCMKRCPVLIPSDHCAGIGFCSKTCKGAAYRYHRVEYKYQDVLQEDGIDRMGFLALRTLLVAGRGRVNAADFNLLIPSYGADHCSGNDFFAVFNLVTNNARRSTENLLQFSLMALYLLAMLEKAEYFAEEEGDDEVKQQEPTTETRLQWGSVLLHMIQIVQCNAYAITEMKKEKDFRLCKTLDLGLAIYPGVSLLNHSCNPCVDLTFFGNKCAVRAMRYVPQGQEVTSDYGTVFYMQRKEERLTLLKQQYLFDCQCEACAGNWGLVDELPSQQPKFRCSKCGGTLPGPQGVDIVAVPCTRCGHEQNVAKRLQKLFKSHEYYSQAIGRLLDGDTAALVVLQRHMMLMDKFLIHPWKDYVSCQATVKQCYRLMGNSYDHKM